MKKKILFLISLVIGLMCEFYIQGQEWKPTELQRIEEKYQDLSARISTLDTYAPDKYPDFQELEKINQLVEMLDFNRREFDLLIQQYNLMEDELFPFIRKYSTQRPELKEALYKTLTGYTGKEEKSMLRLQERIDTVALQVERLEKRIERLQIVSRDKEIAKAEESKQKAEPGKQPTEISTQLLQLEEELKNYTAELGKEEEKLNRLIEKEKAEAAKVEEKRNEAVKMRQEAAATKDKIESLILETFSRVREIRLNGLEIPRLNTTRTFIYLANTAIDTLKTQVQNTGKSIASLKAQRKEELTGKLIKAVAVVAAALLMIFLITGVSWRVSKKIIAAMEENESIDIHHKQRYQTLSAVILSFIKVLVWVLGVLWVLGQLKIDYAPFLVAAGGISLAIGFGAQSLVKDMVSGFFMLMEEQYALGDVVEINGISGTVENISLRTIKFRSLDGALHIIPNGSISLVSNKTHHWSRAVVNVGVSYEADPQRVLSVLNTVCREILSDPGWKENFIEEPIPQGIISFGESALNFRVLAKTKPGQHWAVERELSIRIKNTFDREGIEIPYNYINIIDRTPPIASD